MKNNNPYTASARISAGARVKPKKKPKDQVSDLMKYQKSERKRGPRWFWSWLVRIVSSMYIRIQIRNWWVDIDFVDEGRRSEKEKARDGRKKDIWQQALSNSSPQSFTTWTAPELSIINNTIWEVETASKPPPRLLKEC